MVGLRELGEQDNVNAMPHRLTEVIAGRRNRGAHGLQ